MKQKTSAFEQLFKDKSWFTISNFLTVARIFLTPVIVFGIYQEFWKFVFYLLLVVAITDLLDGYLARLLNENTYLGKFLDPIADKFLLISSFGALAFLQTPSFFIPTWFVVLIFFRETIILLGSFFILKMGVDFEIAPTIWGKLTTFFQLIFLFWLFVCYFFEWAPARTYHALLILLSVFSIISLFQYIKIGFKYFKKRA
jgi:cardiolipin synthase (CMP-forming)